MSTSELPGQYDVMMLVGELEPSADICHSQVTYGELIACRTCFHATMNPRGFCPHGYQDPSASGAKLIHTGRASAAIWPASAFSQVVSAADGNPARPPGGSISITGVAEPSTRITECRNDGASGDAIDTSDATSWARVPVAASNPAGSPETTPSSGATSCAGGGRSHPGGGGGLGDGGG